MSIPRHTTAKLQPIPEHTHLTLTCNLGGHLSLRDHTTCAQKLFGAPMARRSTKKRYKEVKQTMDPPCKEAKHTNIQNRRQSDGHTLLVLQNKNGAGDHGEYEQRDEALKDWRCRGPV
eukprot:1140240-Pelagomonas_calceolata.AAC.4